jgi:site-specific DNA-methyltransferase (adenine-specific)
MIEITNEDNMKLMSRYKDNHFELAIVDPPYGINRSKNFGAKEFGWTQHKRSEWDNDIPPKEYFNELLRVSKNQIIWGGNYFVEYLKPSMGWIFWDKGQREFSTSDGELAYSSFQRKLKVIDLSRGKALADNGGKTIHPTQKPVYLYRWILQNYANEGDKILDTHLGSGTIAIACHEEKFDLTACEIDEEYYNLAIKKLNETRMQTKLF